MGKIMWLKGINILLFMALVIQALTGLILFFEWHISNELFLVNLHKYVGLLMIILAGVHIVLNWGWVRVHFLNRRRG